MDIIFLRKRDHFRHNVIRRVVESFWGPIFPKNVRAFGQRNQGGLQVGNTTFRTSFGKPTMNESVAFGLCHNGEAKVPRFRVPRK